MGASFYGLTLVLLRSSPERHLVNLALGLVIAAAPLAVAGASGAGVVAPVLLGVAVAALSLPRGEIRERYGEWQRFVR